MRLFNKFLCVGLAGFLTACTSVPAFSPVEERSAVETTIIEMTNAAATEPSAFVSLGNSEPAESNGRAPLMFPGRGQFIDLDGQRDEEVSAEPQDPITLNFVDAEISEVLHSVLGEILHQNYVIGEGVEGQITLTTSNPIDRSQVLGALESALQLHSVLLSESNDTIQVFERSQQDEIGTPRLRRAQDNGVGQGIEVLSLRYISVDEAERILEPFAEDGVVLRVDRARNLLLLTGTVEEIRELRETIAMFDVDWLAEMSFGMFYPQQVDVATLASELLAIFDRIGSPIAGIVEFVPIPRINALLVISPRQEHLAVVQRWIERLDQRTNVAAARVYYYRAQNTRAEDLAASLTGLFVGIGGQEGPQSNSQNTSPGNELDGNQSSPDSQLRFVPDVGNNALMIYATPDQFQIIEEALEQIDIPPVQALIEATIAEVTLTDDLRFGVQWFLQNIDNSDISWSDVSSGGVASIFPGFSYVYQSVDIDVALNAIASLTDVNVISAPTLMVLNNRTATLQVGDQVPVTTQSSVGTGGSDAPIVNSVQFRDTGVILEVTPRINNSGVVVLEVSQEVSDVVETTTSGIDSPTIRQRKIDTIVAVQDGETIVLGGLIRDTQSNTQSGVPILMNIPLIGNFFRSNTDTFRRTELLIFIRPRVVRNETDARRITDYMREHLDAVTERFSEVDGN